MPRYEYRLIDVFSSERFSGNPLVVFPEAAGIDAADMQRIARELNLSETTFVLPTSHSGCDYQVRIFTPKVEMPMAGHPTVGTAWVLDHGERVTFLEGVGPITVERSIATSGATFWRMVQPPPSWGPRVENRQVVAALLGIAADDIVPNLPVEVISTGAPFLLVPLRDRAALGRARAQSDGWQALPETEGTYGVFCFTLDTGAPGVTVRSRMFAPPAGVPEDPATGSASGPLGCYLVRYGLVPAGKPARMLSVQGVEMGHPSQLHIEIEGRADAISAVRVGGECVAVGGGYIDL